MFGWLIYFALELLPDLKRNRAARQLGSDVLATVDPGRDVRKLEENLEITDNVKNRQALARGYASAGSHEEAIRMYESCLTGPFKSDPSIMLELSATCFRTGAYERTKEILERLKESRPGFRPQERDLLFARTLEQLDQLEAALAEYKTLSRVYAGAEAKCRYALLLQRTGKTEEAARIFDEILCTAKRNSSHYRRTQKQWIDIAGENFR